jgi:hypothetical protein
MQNPNPWPLAWSITGVCLVTLLGGGAFVAAGLRPATVAPPSSYTPFSAKDNAFKGQGPSGWKMVAGSGANATASFVTFKQGPGYISIDADLAGSLMGDIMKATSGAGGGSDEFGGGGGGGVPGADMIPGGGLGGTDRRPPVEKLHDMKMEAFSKKYEDYSETPMQPLQSGLGEGRISEYTGTKTHKMKGLRVSILSTDKLVSVKCECPEPSYGLMKPAFMKVINSLQAGGG